ncbi:MAG: formate dehydrogenase [Alphaproteobacteria bacterium]|nr:formate dehydrogenase [Alphaproteobacteria bacterium]
MREREEDQRLARRELFRLAGLGTVAGAVAVAGATHEAQAVTEAGADGAGYRETDHVKTYYTLAKF